MSNCQCGGCGCSACGCGSCAETESTDLTEVTGCTPPDSIDAGIKLYVVNDEGCAKLLNNLSQNSIPVYIAADGTIQMRDGSSLAPICLPQLQTETIDETDCVTSLVSRDLNGCLKELTPDPGVAGDYFVKFSANGFCFEGVDTAFPGGSTGKGILIKNGTDLQLIAPPSVDGQYLVGNIDNTYSWVTLSQQTGEQIIIPYYRTLKVTNRVGAAYSATVINGTVEGVILGSPTGEKVRFESAGFSADITANGAGGLDTGAKSANNWYYIWLISDGTALAAMFSLSFTSPTMPSGFTYKILVGVVRNSAADVFVNFFQTDTLNRTVGTNPAGNAMTGNQAGAQAVGIVSVSLAGFVPPIAKTWIPESYITNSNNDNFGFTQLYLYANNNLITEVANIIVPPAIGAAKPINIKNQMTSCPLVEQQTVYWRTDGGAGVQNYTVRVGVLGFTI